MRSGSRTADVDDNQRMTRRHYAIEQAVIEIIGHNRPPASTVAALNHLIDQAEAGKLKEPIARSYAGINGLLTVYPDGREERS